MTEAAVDLEAVEVDVVAVDLVVAVEEVVIAEEVAALAVAVEEVAIAEAVEDLAVVVEAVTVVVTAEAAEDLVEAVEEAVQCVEAVEVVVEIDIAPTKQNCSNLQDDSRSQDFKSRSQSLIQKFFLIFIQQHCFYKKIPPPFFQDNYVATSIVQHRCHALGLSNPSIKLSSCHSKFQDFCRAPLLTTKTFSILSRQLSRCHILITEILPNFDKNSLITYLKTIIKQVATP